MPSLQSIQFVGTDIIYQHNKFFHYYWWLWLGGSLQLTVFVISFLDFLVILVTINSVYIWGLGPVIRGEKNLWMSYEVFRLVDLLVDKKLRTCVSGKVDIQTCLRFGNGN